MDHWCDRDVSCTGLGWSMKLFKTFRLDTANHLLWRDGDRVPLAPKAFDVLTYLVAHSGRLVTQDEILEACWSDTYVNPEVLRKYILEIRKALGDRPDSPEFVETLPKRGYRFIAAVTEDGSTELSSQPTPTLPELVSREEQVEPDTALPERPGYLSQHSYWKLATLFLLVLAVAAGIAAYIRAGSLRANTVTSTNTSIAVLPFADMSEAKDQEYFSDGLTEQLINTLAKVSGLKVVGRSSAFQFKGKNEDLRDVGRKLGVANVLEGSVRRDGNHVRITAELIKTVDGFQLWSQTYDRESKDIFAVEDEIAAAATEALRLKLLGSKGQAATHSVNPEAYQAYLQGQYFSRRGQIKEDLGKALDYADTAIRLDERYGSAWALRSSVQNMMAGYGLTDPAEGYRKARSDAERAIALDPGLASAYLALANIQIDYDWDWAAANVSLAKAATIEPGNVEVLRLRSHLYRIVGDLEQATKLAEEGIALDPLRPNSYSNLEYLLYLQGRYSEARVSLQRALDLNPQATYVHLTMGKILISEGKPEQALREADKESIDWAKLIGYVLAYHALGREQESNSALGDLIAKHGSTAAFQVAQLYAFRGESDKSFEWLERAFKTRDPGMVEIKTDPLFQNLRHDKRYVDLLERMHLSK
jgi:TolB-like protein/DNA-binding winged helix-turn-helix (wHTH) protein